jgi:hypothetical protein
MRNSFPGRGWLAFALLLAIFSSAPFGSAEQSSRAPAGWASGGFDPPSVSTPTLFLRQAAHPTPAPFPAHPGPDPLLPALPPAFPAPRHATSGGPLFSPSRPRRFLHDALAPPRA